MVEGDLYGKALHDGVTGLESKDYFDDNLKSAIARSKRLGKPAGIFSLVLEKETQSIPPEMFKEITGCLNDLGFDHLTRYDNKFGMILCFSTKELNEAKIADINSKCVDSAKTYMIQYGIASMLTNDTTEHSVIISELELKALQAIK